jgi:hypothetical protein
MSQLVIRLCTAIFWSDHFAIRTGNGRLHNYTGFTAVNSQNAILTTCFVLPGGRIITDKATIVGLRSLGNINSTRSLHLSFASRIVQY